MPVFVGTSGWQYRHWRSTYYPEGVPQRAWLEHYARHFRTIEVNNAFYRLPEAKVFAAWAGRTPDDFVVGVKASRYLTHIKRLRDTDEAVGRLMERARHLGPKLGPVLLQLPPNLPVALDDLDRTLAAFPPDVRLAVEVRHDSWFVEETFSLLASHGAAFCLADSPKRVTPVRRTVDWAYLRLHEGTADPPPCYAPRRLRSWADRLADLWGPSADAFVFFNNDPRACALRDATLFARAAERAGLDPTRVPPREAITLG